MRAWIRRNTNAWLSAFGLRIVSARWGPRGPMDSLRRVRAQGVVPRQIVDVGASDGTWTRECLEVYPDARYLLIDPLAANVRALEELTRCHPNVCVWHGALGRTPGTSISSCTAKSRASCRATASPRAAHACRVRRSICFSAAICCSRRSDQGRRAGVRARGAPAARPPVSRSAALLLEVSYRRIYATAAVARGDRLRQAAGFRIYDICTYAGRPSDGELTQSDILSREGSPLFANEAWC
jgi:hypothetical protein